MKKIKQVQQGDVITFLASDSRYKALLCTSTYVEKSPHSYTFAVLSYDAPIKPTADHIRDGQFFGIGNTKNNLFVYPEHQLAKMWVVHPEIKPYFLGSYGLVIWRKDFMKFRDNLQLVANIPIIDNLDKNGNGSMNASSWSFLQDFFVDKYKTELAGRGQRKFSVHAIIIDL